MKLLNVLNLKLSLLSSLWFSFVITLQSLCVEVCLCTLSRFIKVTETESVLTLPLPKQHIVRYQSIVFSPTWITYPGFDSQLAPWKLRRLSPQSSTQCVFWTFEVISSYITLTLDIGRKMSTIQTCLNSASLCVPQTCYWSHRMWQSHGPGPGHLRAELSHAHTHTLSHTHTHTLSHAHIHTHLAQHGVAPGATC